MITDTGFPCNHSYVKIPLHPCKAGSALFDTAGFTWYEHVSTLYQYISALPYRLNQIFGIFAVGIISTFPVPRYTFTSPSPEAAEPIKDLPERSTVKSRLPLHAMA